jgi:hypothetical protein
MEPPDMSAASGTRFSRHRFSRQGMMHCLARLNESLAAVYTLRRIRHGMNDTILRTKRARRQGVFVLICSSVISLASMFAIGRLLL